MYVINVIFRYARFFVLFGLYRIIRVRITLLSLLNPDGFSHSFVLYALTGLLAIARHRPTENPLPALNLKEK